MVQVLKKGWQYMAHYVAGAAKKLNLNKSDYSCRSNN
jgi:hypothetical protein